MTGHDYHAGWPGFHPDQILHDGCAECHSRSRDLVTALAHLDHERWDNAWARAVRYGLIGLDDASGNEIPLLVLLWQLVVAFQWNGTPAALAAFLAPSPAPGTAHGADGRELRT